MTFAACLSQVPNPLLHAFPRDFGVHTEAPLPMWFSDMRLTLAKQAGSLSATRMNDCKCFTSYLTSHAQYDFLFIEECDDYCANPLLRGICMVTLSLPKNFDQPMQIYPSKAVK